MGIDSSVECDSENGSRRVTDLEASGKKKISPILSGQCYVVCGVP